MEISMNVKLDGKTVEKALEGGAHIIEKVIEGFKAVLRRKD